MIFFIEKVKLNKYEEKDTHRAISSKCKKGTTKKIGLDVTTVSFYSLGSDLQVRKSGKP